MRRVASRLELSEGQLKTLVARGGSRANGASPAGAGASSPALDQGLKAEQTFLALCIALPDAGAATLSSIDPDELLTSELHRRAARHLARRTASPLADLPRDDDELARLVADLVARAGRGGELTVERLEHARLILEMERLDRAIRRARGQGGADVTKLARERETVVQAIHEVVTRLEKPL
jgi:DNA primase